MRSRAAVQSPAAYQTRYAGAGSAMLNLREYMEDDGRYNVMGFIPRALKAAIRAKTTVVDVSAYVQACFDAAMDDSHSIVLPRGKFIFEDQVLLTVPESTERLLVSGHGCEIFTAGAIAGLAITGGGTTPGGVTIEGIKVNHRGNADAIAGIWCYGTNHVKVRDCQVEAHGVAAAYAALLLSHVPGHEDDNGYGCFWTVVEDFVCRKRSGADAGNISAGIKLRGSCNMTTIRGGSLKTCTKAIHLTREAGQNAIANAVLIDGTAMESTGTAGTIGVHADQATNNPIGGLRIVNTRTETTETFVSLTGATDQPVVSLFMAGNYFTPDLVTYLNNPNNLRYRSFDECSNPIVRPSFQAYRAIVLQATDASTPQHGAIVIPAAGDRGLVVCDNGGTPCATVEWQGTGTKARHRTTNASELAVSTVQGISATATDAKNLRGTATLVSGTVAVAFPVAEADAAYFVLLSVADVPEGTAESVSWTGRATGGFTINSSNPNSVSVVHWMIVR